jgi:hypothetical protein
MLERNVENILHCPRALHTHLYLYVSDGDLATYRDRETQGLPPAAPRYPRSVTVTVRVFVASGDRRCTAVASIPPSALKCPRNLL